MTKCSNCGKQDHNKRTCRMQKSIPVEINPPDKTLQQLAEEHPNPKVLEQFTAYENTMNTLHTKAEELMNYDTCAKCDKGGWEYNQDKEEWLCYEHRDKQYEETKEKIVEEIKAIKQIYYYDTIPQCPDTERAFHHLMTKLGPSFNNNHFVIWALIKHSYDMTPTNFRVLGGYHTDASGKLYFSVKHTLAPKVVNTLHFYGALRYNTFTAHTMTYKAREHIYTFNYESPKIKHTGYSIRHE